MDFTDDPFKDYRYEDPYNIEDPFADAAPVAPRPQSAAAFGAEPFAPAASSINGGAPSGRVSAPPARAPAWSAWPDDSWPDNSAWAETDNSTAPAAAAWPADRNTAAARTDWNTDSWGDNTDNWTSKTDSWANKSDNWATKTDNWATKTDNWATKTDNWTAEFPSTDRNKNLNETWPSAGGTLPAKKEKSPKPVKYAKSLVHTIGGIGRSRHKKAAAASGGGAKADNTSGRSVESLPSEEQQWAWAAAESRRLQLEADQRRQQEDAELQLALAISRQEK